MITNNLSYAFMRLSATRFNEFMLVVIYKVNSQPAYNSLQPLVKTLTHAMEDWNKAAEAAKSRATADIYARNKAYESYLSAAHELARTADFEAAGNTDYLVNAGFELHKTRHAVTQIGRVEGVKVVNALQSRTIDVSFRAVHHAKSYLIKKWNKAVEKWEVVSSGSKNRLTLTNLSSGEHATFCVCALGTNNLCGPDSESISIWIA